MDIEKIVSSITGDKIKVENFKKDPVGTVKGVVGDNVSPEIVNSVVSAVQAKLGGTKLGGIADKIGGLFK